MTDLEGHVDTTTGSGATHWSTWAEPCHVLYWILRAKASTIPSRPTSGASNSLLYYIILTIYCIILVLACISLCWGWDLHTWETKPKGGVYMWEVPPAWRTGFFLALGSGLPYCSFLMLCFLNAAPWLYETPRSTNQFTTTDYTTDDRAHSFKIPRRYQTFLVIR